MPRYSCLLLNYPAINSLTSFNQIHLNKASFQIIYFSTQLVFFNSASAFIKFGSFRNGSISHSLTTSRSLFIVSTFASRSTFIPFYICTSTFLLLSFLLTITIQPLLFLFLVLSLIAAIISWLNELQIESNEGRFTQYHSSNLILAFSSFVISELFLFAVCFWAFIHFMLLSSFWVYFNFPALGIASITPFSFSLTNVLLLLYSSLPLHAAQIWIKRGVKSRTLEGISQVGWIASIFIGTQLQE